MNLQEIYDYLFAHFGPQDWWPLKNGFEPREWEVCVGAILTQNTNWSNVEKALVQMKNKGCQDVGSLMKLDNEQLEQMIRSSGFYKMKAQKLMHLGREVLRFGGTEDFLRNVSREQLLNIKGIGPETADSILLYACHKHYFVVDAYTRRVFLRLGLLEHDLSYEDVRSHFEKNLPRDVDVYKEFHALIVMLAKDYCKKKPLCEECPLMKGCNYTSPARQAQYPSSHF